QRQARRGYVTHPDKALSDGARPCSSFLTEAVGNSEHELPVRGRPIYEAFGLRGLGKAKGLATVERPPSELTAHALEAGIVEVAKVFNLLASQTPFHLNEDGAAQRSIRHPFTLQRNRLGAERRIQARLVCVGIASRHPLPSCPPAVDDLPEVGVFLE